MLGSKVRAFARMSWSVLSLIVLLAAGLALPYETLAASSRPGWEISSVAHPTNFSAEDNAKCMRASQPLCDQYVVTLTNVGNERTTGPVTITDTVPTDLRAIGGHGENLRTEGQFNCPANTTTTAVCVYEDGVAPETTLAIFVEVEVEANTPTSKVTNVVSVSGGGAPPIATHEPLALPNTIDGPVPAFGVSAFGFAPREALGNLDTQAGDHPYEVTSVVNLNTVVENHPLVHPPFVFGSVEPPKDISVDLPLGFLGNPTATAKCSELQLAAQGAPRETECPPTSRVGEVTLFSEDSVASSTNPEVTSATPIYNMVPEAGFPAQFGLRAYNKPVQLYASVVHLPSGYALRVASPGIPNTINVEGIALTFFGNPQATDGESGTAQAFFTNPTDCDTGPLAAKAEADSWVHPRQWVSAESTAYPQITGCNLLQFEPTTEMHPELTQAEAPSGYQIKINLRQAPELAPILATPQLKNVTMTLPEGMTLSPGAGDGLQGCEATGPNGIDMPTNLPNGAQRTPTEAGEGEAIGPDGMSHLTAGHCPHQSQIGTVELVTPVLNSPLQGRLYVAQPKCGGPNNQPPCTPADATNGNLFGLYLEAEGSGVVVKLAGSASIDPSTGRITARFLENPQLPVSEVTINLKGGARAPLANPRQCGPASSNSDLAPWSAPETPDAIVSSAPFQVSWDGATAPCPTTLPFAPTLLAGPTNVRAGAFGSFTLTVGRGDRQQDIARVQVHMPPGLLGMLSKVGLCGEGQANEGTCEAASELGSVNVAAGSGSHPLWVTGKVYLTGPYEGAPFGLSVVVPAVAGPFNLGNVIVRSRIDIDLLTSAVTITTDPLPQFKDGIPLRIQTLNVAVTREGFLFNPTHCTGLQVATSIDAAQGASASLTSPMSLEGCARLPFSPTFKASTASKTSKAKGANLAVTVTSTPGQANVGSVVVKLPKQLPARLTTLQQACTEAVFAQNPASCPAASVVGSAKAVTPVLSNAVVGPVYLVSHGGAAFPDVVVILQGEGVRVDLVGNTDIKGQITTSTFASVPDVPIGSFAITLPEGPHSALTSNLPAKAKGDLCSTKLTMPTTITGQNGARIEQSTKIAVLGCPKVRKKTKAKKK